jgi:hypothetical protein
VYKIEGGLGRFTGSLITAAGGILELPSTLLALPYILTNRQELIATVTAAAELEGPAGAAAADIADAAAAAGTSSLAQPGGSPAEFRVGTGAKVYLGVAGALAIPGLIAMGLGNFINNAGKSAMRDKLTIQVSKSRERSSFGIYKQQLAPLLHYCFASDFLFMFYTILIIST